ncbi:unnamed protein product [Cuscuta campestris]|uniref:Uncharacterized protein n=1 Tax=Cuscuta campestris TaxID=132261 RepID=A0A484LC83_9ASTE|nr:unnamed protein product [Cuscuta campestris]
MDCHAQNDSRALRIGPKVQQIQGESKGLRSAVNSNSWRLPSDPKPVIEIEAIDLIAKLRAHISIRRVNPEERDFHEVDKGELAALPLLSDDDGLYLQILQPTEVLRLEYTPLNPPEEESPENPSTERGCCEEEILVAKFNKNKNGLPYPLLIYSILKDQSFEKEENEEEEPIPPLLQVDGRHLEGSHFNDMAVAGTTTAPTQNPASVEYQLSFVEKEIKALQQDIDYHNEIAQRAAARRDTLIHVANTLRQAKGDRRQGEKHNDKEVEPTNTTDSQQAR